MRCHLREIVTEIDYKLNRGTRRFCDIIESGDGHFMHQIQLDFTSDGVADTIIIQPFKVEGNVDDFVESEIDFVILRHSNTDSRGGLQSKNYQFRQVFHQISDILECDFGFDTVPTESPYF